MSLVAFTMGWTRINLEKKRRQMKVFRSERSIVNKYQPCNYLLFVYSRQGNWFPKVERQHLLSAPVTTHRSDYQSYATPGSFFFKPATKSIFLQKKVYFVYWLVWIARCTYWTILGTDIVPFYPDLPDVIPLLIH